MKSLLTLFLAFVCLVGKAQNTHKNQKPVKEIINVNKFLGIGLFKLGSDTNTLINYANTHVDYVRDIDSWENYLYATKNGINQLLRLKHNSNSSENMSDLSYNPDIKQYFLKSYVISGIEIKNIKLKYYKNGLIEFHSDYNSDIEDALIQKYGQPKTESITKKVNCLYNLTGISRPLEEITYCKSWNNTSAILALSAIGTEYDDHCNNKSISFFEYSCNIPELNKWEENYSANKKITAYKRDLKDF